MLLIKFTECACRKSPENAKMISTRALVMQFCFTLKTGIYESQGTTVLQVFTSRIMTYNIIWWNFMYSKIRCLRNTYPWQWHKNVRESNIDEFAITTKSSPSFVKPRLLIWGRFNDVFEWWFPVRYKGLQLPDFGLERRRFFSLHVS